MNVSPPLATQSRSRSRFIDKALHGARQCTYKTKTQNDRKSFLKLLLCVSFLFMQGIKGYEFDMYLDIHKLRHGERDISHPLVKKFLKNKTPYESLCNYAKYGDGSLLRRIQVLYIGIIVILALTLTLLSFWPQICERYPQDLPDIISKIKKMTCKDNSHAGTPSTHTHTCTNINRGNYKLSTQ